MIRIYSPAITKHYLRLSSINQQNFVNAAFPSLISKGRPMHSSIVRHSSKLSEILKSLDGEASGSSSFWSNSDKTVEYTRAKFRPEINKEQFNQKGKISSSRSPHQRQRNKQYSKPKDPIIDKRSLPRSSRKPLLSESIDHFRDSHINNQTNAENIFFPEESELESHSYVPRSARMVDLNLVREMVANANESSGRFTAIEENSSEMPKRYKQYLQKMKSKKEAFQKKTGYSPSKVTEKDVSALSVKELKMITEKKLKMRQQRREATGSKMNDGLNNKDNKSRSINEKEEPTKEIVLPKSGLSLRSLASTLSMKLMDLRKVLENLMGEPLDSIVASFGEVSDAESSDTKLLQDLDELRGTKPEDRPLEPSIVELLLLELNARNISTAPQDSHIQLGYNITIRNTSDGNEDGALVTKQGKDSAGSTQLEGLRRLQEQSSLPLEIRAPVVAICGHVDHGKTTLLDSLRLKKISDSKSDQKFDRNNSELSDSCVAGTEEGGITQKLSTFDVHMDSKRKVVFLDTPGHAAFSEMRNHGAVAADIAVLVVALDDGVRPQTVEAIQMAKRAGASIIVALNKVDKIVYEERAEYRTRTLNQLMEHGLVVEEYGGDIQVVEVSGKTGEGIEGLIESLLLQAEVLELQAAFSGPAEGVVLDSHVERGCGVVAEVLLKWGNLKIGDNIVVGNVFGKVKSMSNNCGDSVKTAGPSDAVRLLGLRSLPLTGQELLTVDSEQHAKDIVDRRQRIMDLRSQREAELAALRANRNSEIIETTEEYKDAGRPVLNVMLKADAVCTLDALRRISEDIAARASGVKVDIVGAGIGDVHSSDVELVGACGDALILGFNIGVANSSTRSLAKQLDVSICREGVIYRLEEEMVRAISERLPKERILHKEGSATVQSIFRLNGKSKSAEVVAGLLVQSGRLRNSSGGGGRRDKANHHHHEHVPHKHGDQFIFRIIRDGNIILDESPAHSSTLKRYKDTVHEVDNGIECGFALDGYSDFHDGDIVECYHVKWQSPSQILVPV